MKTFLLGLLLAALPPWLSRTVADQRADVRVVVVASGGGGGSVPTETDEKVHLLRKIQESGRASHGWLGVSIGKVSEALADQLDVKDRGVVVLNVVEDSPAERAGFEAHDIILSVDGETVSGDIGSTVELIGSRAPGDRIDVVVLRHGDEKTLEVELGGGFHGHFKWKFDITPDIELEESLSTRGKMMFRDDDGRWTIKNLGDLNEWTGDASEAVKLLLPEGRSQSTQIFVDGNRKSVEMKVKSEADGSVLVIGQEDGGEITVTRSHENDEETTNAYADEDALAGADPEAFELYQRADPENMVHINVDGLDGLMEKLGDLELDFGRDLKGLHEDLFDWRGELGEHFLSATQDYREAFQEAQEAFQQVMQAFREKHADGQSGAAPGAGVLPAGPKGHGQAMFGPHRLGHLGKPKHTFTVRKDGTIEVRIRKSDSELVQLFENADDLAQRHPALSEKYQNLMSSDVED